MADDDHSGVSTVLTVLGCAVVYALFFYFNQLLFKSLEFTQGVNWVFLPSGLRLSLVLIFLWQGALGISLASILITWCSFDTPWLFSVVTGLISGFAPWLARRLAMDWLKLDPDIQCLHPAQLLKLSVLFAVTSAVLHQLWFAWNADHVHFLQDTLVMVTGDLLGTLLMLFALRLFILWLRKPRENT
jgi:hypothetical protein